MIDSLMKKQSPESDTARFDACIALYTQATSRCSVQRDDLSSQARQRFEDIVVLH